MDSALGGEEIRASLAGMLFGHNLIYLPQTGSTNTIAKQLAREGAPEGTVVIADEQTAGRGRLGRRWLAPPGTCLLCSVLFRPRLALARVHYLTMICSLAAADAIAAVGQVAAGLKWPNDLVIPSSHAGTPSPAWRKLAGVLTETGVAGDRLAYAIVGMGINANVPPAALPALAPDATSILAETGHLVDRSALLRELLAGIEARYAALRDGEDPRAEWTARLLTLGQVVQASTATGVLTGVAESVDETGALIVRTADGDLHKLAAGDVTLQSSGAEGRLRSPSEA